jgi:hypothetical protein
MCACPIDPLLKDRGVFIDSFFENDGFHFLTHAHNDHMEGLSGVFTSQIYCSEITRDLVMMQKPTISKHRFIVLKENTPTRITTDTQVIAVNSHHCDGSLMLVFILDNIRILYTGDFRFHLDMRNLGSVDKMYYDDTLVKLDVIGYPSEQDSFENLVIAINEIRESHGFQTPIYINTQILGVEPLLRKVADYLHENYEISESLLGGFRGKQLEYLMAPRIVFRANLILSNRAKDDQSKGYWIFPTSVHFLCLNKDQSFKQIPDNHRYVWFSTHPDKTEIARLGAVCEATEMIGCNFVIEHIKCARS